MWPGWVVQFSWAQWEYGARIYQTETQGRWETPQSTQEGPGEGRNHWPQISVVLELGGPVLRAPPFCPLNVSH